MKKYRDFLIECGCGATESAPEEEIMGDVMAALTTEPEPISADAANTEVAVDPPTETITPENAAAELETMANKAIELSNLLRKLTQERSQEI